MTHPGADPARSWSVVLFDLDGTVIDSAAGIVDRIAETLRRMGEPVPAEADLLRLVGPPLREAFTALGLDAARAEEAVLLQRRIAAERGPSAGAALYPGMAGLLADLSNAGIPLALATSKGQAQTESIADHFDLTPLFRVIVGASEDDARSAKADIVAETLRQLVAAGVDISRPVLVGDRGYDVVGAAANDVPAILVEWGYGSPAEADGALATVASVDQLRALLLG